MADQWKECVIDATMGYAGGFCFCPIEGDINGEFSVVTGLNICAGKPPHGWKLVAVVHEDGNDEAQAFLAEHDDEISGILERQRVEPA